MIGQCKVQVTEAELLQGFKEITYCPNPDNDHDYIESLVLTFSFPVP